MNTKFFRREILFNKYTMVDILEMILRFWMGYILIKNSGVGILTPLEDLGMPDHVYRIIKGMWDTGFMMHLVKLIELLAGILLIVNLFIPATLVILLPVIINIYGIHIFLFNSYHTKGLYMLLICFFLLFRYRYIFRPFLSAKTRRHRSNL